MNSTEQKNREPKEPQEEAMPVIKAARIDPSKLNLRDELIVLNRCAKVVKGGRRFSFSALVVVGDGEGHVGLGFGKANEVPEAIAKAVENGKKNLIQVPLVGRTVPHEVYGLYSTARVLLKPASEGTGLIAGAQVRKVLQLAGVQDILAKSLGSDNVMNVAKATLQGLASLKRPEHVARLRGKKIDELIGKRAAAIYEDTLARVLGEDARGDSKAEEKPAASAEQPAGVRAAAPAPAPAAPQPAEAAPQPAPAEPPAPDSGAPNPPSAAAAAPAPAETPSPAEATPPAEPGRPAEQPAEEQDRPDSGS